MKGFYAFCIIGADAATEEKRDLADIIGEHTPVELLSIATW